MPVSGIDTTGGFAATPTKGSSKSSATSFRAVLSEESTKASAPAAPAPAPAPVPATAPASAAPATADAAKATTPKAPKGEKTDAVEGHRYAEITAGPRNGMFLNTSGNARNGLAFTLVERDGHHFHVYGTGADRKVFRVKGDDATSPSGGTKPAAS